MNRRTAFITILAAGLVLVAGAPSAVASTTTIQQVTDANGTDTDRITVGETMVVQGSTNLRPDDNAILVDLEDEDGDIVAAVSTDQWGQDGVWSVSINTTGLSPGEYTLVADDGSSTDVETIRLVRPTPTASPTQTATETPTATPSSTPTDVPTPTPTATPQPTLTPTATSTPSPTQGTGVGLTVFNAAVAITGVFVTIILYRQSR